MRHGRKDPWDKPWVAYAAIGGVIVVIILALFYFLGGGGTAAAPANPGTGPSAQSTSAAHSTTTTKSQTTLSGSTTVVKPVATAPVVPDQGVSVKVSYLGGFSGSYGVTGSLVKVQDSGVRVYTVDNPTGTITASFHKDDGSKHELTVEIWNNGKVVKFSSTSSPNGDVSISYAV